MFALQQYSVVPWQNNDCVLSAHFLKLSPLKKKQQTCRIISLRLFVIELCLYLKLQVDFGTECSVEYLL